MNATAHDPSPHPGFLRRLFTPAPRKYTPHQFMNITCAIAIVFVLFFMWLDGAWHLNVAPQEVKCLPQTYFLVSQERPEHIERGKVYTYRSQGLAPLLPDNVNMGKIVAGVPGDLVSVTAEGISINGQHWGPLNLEVVEKAGLELSELYTEYTIPDGKYLMLGTLPRSYDGRYWGLVEKRQFIGRAYPLW